MMSDLRPVYRIDRTCVDDPERVVPVLVVCPTCGGDGHLVTNAEPIEFADCPDCTPLDDGIPSGVRLVYRDQETV